VISGLVRSSSGSIFWDEWDLTQYPPHEIARKGIVQVPEGRKLFPQMTVFENLMVGGSHSKVKVKREENMEKVYQIFPTLRERSKQLAGTLSGGQQQMLAIGRALMAEPISLMLDEPSLGLAPLVVREIFRVTKGLNQEGLTVFLVEQNIRQSLLICHNGYVLQNGRIVLSGTGDELLDNEVTKRAYLGL